MSDAQFRGACLCGGVTFTISSAPLAVGNCFCADCQVNAGGPTQTSAHFPASVITVTDSESLETTFVIGKTNSGQPKIKHFCKRCGCMLWMENHLLGFPAYGVRVSLIEGGLEKLKPTVERFVARRPSYVAAVPGAVQLEQQ